MENGESVALGRPRQILACSLSGLRLRLAHGRVEVFCEHCNEAHSVSDELAAGIPLSAQTEIDLADLVTPA